MIVMQSEKVDSGEKYILSFQSTEKSGVSLPANTTRVKVHVSVMTNIEY